LTWSTGTIVRARRAAIASRYAPAIVQNSATGIAEQQSYSTIAAAAIALSAGTALASENSSDNGFAVYLESVNKAPTTDRQYLTTEGQGDYTGTESGHRDSSH